MSETNDPRGQIIRHGAPTRAFGVKYLSVKEMDAIQDHVRGCIGGEPTVLHEIASEGLHIDVLAFPPTPTRNFSVLCTMGMSAEEMTTPKDWEWPRRIELVMALPADWPLDKLLSGDHRDEPEGDQERWYWPVRLLKNLARLPQSFRTMLWWGHTIPNGDPPEAFADGTRFCCAVVLFPEALGDGLATLEMTGGSLLNKTRKRVAFLGVAPLFPEEVERKLREGMEPIDEGLQSIPIESWFRETRTNFGSPRKG